MGAIDKKSQKKSASPAGPYQKDLSYVWQCLDASETAHQRAILSSISHTISTRPYIPHASKDNKKLRPNRTSWLSH